MSNYRKQDTKRALTALEQALDLLYEADGTDEKVLVLINRAINLLDRSYPEDYNENYRPLTLDEPHFEDTIDPDLEDEDIER